MCTFPMHIWAVQRCRNIPAVGPHLQNHTHLTHKTPASLLGDLCSSSISAHTPFFSARRFTFTQGWHRNSCCLFWKMLRALFLMAPDFCLPTDPSAMWEFYLQWQWMQQVQPGNSENMIVKLNHFTFQPQVLVHNSLPHDGQHWNIDVSHVPVFKDSQRQMCLPVQNSPLVPMEISAK